jgi:thioredoxin
MTLVALGHAHEERRLGAVQQDIDMTAREAEGCRDVLARALVEETHHHYRALGLAEAIHAAAKADALLGVREQGLRRRPVAARLDGADRMMWAREVVTAAFVTCRIDHDAGEQRPVLAYFVGQLARLGKLQKRAEGIVHAVDGVFGAKPFPPSQPGKLDALLANDAIECVEDVFFVIGGHLSIEVSRPTNLTPRKKCRLSGHPLGRRQTMQAKTNVIEADDASFEKEVIAAEMPVLVDFGARWCPPCRALAPIVERVATETLGRFKVVTMDIDASPRTSRRYGVRGVPTLLVFRKGEKTAQHLGATTKERILELLAR